MIWSESAGGQISGPATVIGDVVYVSTFSGNSTIGFDLGTGRRVFCYDDGEYGPVVSDGQTLYLTGGVTVIAFEPIDIGNYKYKTKQGPEGHRPPHRAAQGSQAGAQAGPAAGAGTARRGPAARRAAGSAGQQWRGAVR